jgi:hypothetical protein
MQFTHDLSIDLFQSGFAVDKNGVSVFGERFDGTAQQ